MTWRAEAPASMHRAAQVWRRSWKRTPSSSPAALTAGRKTDPRSRFGVRGVFGSVPALPGHEEPVSANPAWVQTRQVREPGYEKIACGAPVLRR